MGLELGLNYFCENFDSVKYFAKSNNYYYYNLFYYNFYYYILRHFPNPHGKEADPQHCKID